VYFLRQKCFWQPGCLEPMRSFSPGPLAELKGRDKEMQREGWDGMRKGV